MAARLASLMSVKSLASKLQTGISSLRVLDGTLSHGGKIAREEFLTKHIPEAQFFDLDECTDKNTIYENMLPKAEHFADYVGNLGIGNKHHVVIYDNSPSHKIFSAPRVWWMFRVFGHNNVSVLDGGLPKWEEEGQTVTDKISEINPEKFSALQYNAHMVKSFEDIIANLKSREYQMIDARSSGRFNGTEPEPRDDNKPGHIPGGLNIPFKTLVNPDTGLLKSDKELLHIFKAAGVDMTKPLLSSCGSGITACFLAFAAHLCNKDVQVYDGSWMEYYLRASPEQIDFGSQRNNGPAAGA